MSSDVLEVRRRLAAKLAEAAADEARIGKQRFLLLPPRLQEQLAVLQGQSTPSDASLEALLAAEHNLTAYREKLRHGLDLTAQLVGARARARVDRRRGAGKAFLTIAVLAALAAGAFVFYTQKLAEKRRKCVNSEACTLRGLCGARLRLEQSPVELVCAARSDDDCAQGPACAKSGRCALQGGVCAATEDSHCRAAPPCKSDGKCSADKGRCIASKPADCAGSAACKERGACSPQHGACVAARDEDCAGAVVCKKHGACTEYQNRCVKALPGFGKAPPKKPRRARPRRRAKPKSAPRSTR